MPRFSGRALAALAVWAVLGHGWSVAAVPPSDTLFPATTKGYVSATDFTKLKEQWNQMQIGHLMNDPAMKPFAEDLQRQFEDRISDLHDRLGLSLDDMKGVPQGEVALAVIQPGPNQAAVALMMDVTGHSDKARAMLAKRSANYLSHKAKQKSETVAGITATLFEVPRKEDDREVQQVGYFLHDNLLVTTDNWEVLRAIMVRASGKVENHLASVKGYQTALARVKKDAGNEVPSVRWYVEPMGYMETARTATPEENRRKGKSMVQLMRNQGFDALQAVGGFVNLKSGKYELLHRTAIYAPPPYQKSMKMLVFPNTGDFAPQRWVPRDIATYINFYCDILNGFDNFGTLFDELFGEGQSGVWDDVLHSLHDDPNGPKIDLRADLMVHLGKRVSVLGDYQLPITVDSERVLFAIEVKNEQAVMAALEKWMKNDPSTKRRDFKGKIIWEMIEQQEEKVPDLSVSVGDIPAVGVPPVISEPKKAPTKEERLLPHAAVTVSQGYLLIASHIDFLLKILPGVEERKTLGRDVDFQQVQKELDKLGIKDTCVRSFSRTDEEFRTTYELIRQGKMPESETMLARLLNAITGPSKKGVVRKQKVDGSKLPEYQVVRRYLGSAGLLVTSEKDGWFAKGFLLPKESAKK